MYTHVYKCGFMYVHLCILRERINHDAKEMKCQYLENLSSRYTEVLQTIFANIYK